MNKIKLTLPYNTKVGESFIPTTGIVIELPQNTDGTIKYNCDGTFTLVLNRGSNNERDGDSGIDNVISINNRPQGRVETATMIAPKMGGKAG